ncbi:MAG: DHH family phosphoesterase [Methanocellales archaeon]|nr:DHH family phosphoesterase [Methanocellales archaeon]
MIEKLDVVARDAARRLATCDYVRVVSHNDADGITSAGIICNALYRGGIHFRASIVSHLDEEVIKGLNDQMIVFCDMGSGQPDLIAQLRGDIVVIDHHAPAATDVKYVQLNPHLVGIDGTFELSASGAAYTMAQHLGDNIDLAGLAIVGAIGDQQEMVSANKDILSEAVEHNVITIGHGLRIGDGDIAEILEYSTDPYLDITGDAEKIHALLNELNVHGNIGDLNPEELRRLASALVLKVAKTSADVAESLIGERYELNREVIQDAFQFRNLLNACGKFKNTGLALSLCLRDDSAIDEAKRLYLGYQKKVGSELKKMDIKEVKSIRYAYSSDKDVAGTLAGTIIRYIASDKPVLVLIKHDSKVKISARASKKLVEKGVDLSIAMREGAKQVGGTGGGHSVASGASIPSGEETKFIEAVDAIITKQLGEMHEM